MRIFGFIVFTTLAVANLVRLFHNHDMTLLIMNYISLAVETSTTPISSGKWFV